MLGGARMKLGGGGVRTNFIRAPIISKLISIKQVTCVHKIININTKQQWFKQATLRNTELNGTDRYFFQLGILLLVFIREEDSRYMTIISI